MKKLIGKNVNCRVLVLTICVFTVGLPGGLVVKNLSPNARDVRETSSIPGSGRSPEEGHGTPLQYSCLENPMDRGAWKATFYGVTKSWS